MTITSHTPTPSILDAIIIAVSEQSSLPVTEDSRLDDLGLDSLDMVSICLAIEEELHLPFGLDYDPVMMITVRDISNHIAERSLRQDGCTPDKSAS